MDQRRLTAARLCNYLRTSESTHSDLTAKSMSIDQLINYGVKSINDHAPCPSQNTLVVIGVARGGTSMVAGILHHLGVNLHAAKNPVYEDIHIAAAFEELSCEALTETINRCNQADQWAWKRPKAIDYLPLVEAQLRNPRFIFVFRDIFAIANRNEISMGSDILPLMNNALEQYAKAVAFMGETSAPCLLCSGEKLTRYPGQVIKAIANFSGINPDAQTLQSAIESVNPEPDKYLKASRINRTHGQIGLVTNNAVKGWAAWWSKEEPADVEIYLDDQLYKVVSANESRPHLARKNRTRNGFCGFSVEFPDGFLQAGTTIRAKIKNDATDLDYSPWEIQPVA